MHIVLDFLNFEKYIFGVRQSSFSIILKKFLIFGKLTFGDSYKKDSYSEKAEIDSYYSLHISHTSELSQGWFP